MNYSPRPKDQYRLLSVDEDPVTLCEAHDLGEALWNYFWLSTPDIDKVPGRSDWWRVYKPDADAWHALVADVEADVVLYRKLMMHPREFLSWFQTEDPSIFDAFNTHGAGAWVDTVISRATEAAGRIEPDRGRIGSSGNVVQVQFGRRA